LSPSAVGGANVIAPPKEKMEKDRFQGKEDYPSATIHFNYSLLDHHYIVSQCQSKHIFIIPAATTPTYLPSFYYPLRSNHHPHHQQHDSCLSPPPLAHTAEKKTTDLNVSYRSL